jgi:hypothetical protein
MSVTTTERLMVAPAEAARIVGISRAQLYAEMAAKRIAARKCGKRTLVELASLRAWLDALPAYQSKAAA